MSSSGESRRLGPSRRDVLALGGSAVAGVAGLGISTRAQAQRGPRRVIDVHCHVFNGKDIPCRSFLNIVVLKHYQCAGAAHGQPGVSSSLEGLAHTIVALVKADAPSVAVERDCLRRGDELCGETSLVTALRSNRVGGGREARIIADYERLVRGEPRQRYFIEDSWLQDRQALDALMNSLRSGPSALPRSNNALEGGSALERRRMANKLAGEQYEFNAVKKWGDILGSPRRNIIKQYLSSFDGSTHKLALFAPAIVDFSFWLDEIRGPSPLSEQSAIMDELSRAPGLTATARMHGYIAFDPLRQVKSEQDNRVASPLTLCKEAIASRGFLGVKLYSPMGFKPFGNAVGAIPFPGNITNRPRELGADLDRVLMALYSWCASDGVAILAHTSNSNGACEGFGARADPSFWRDVLAEKPELKVCWAHFGRFGTNGVEAQPAADLTQTWEWAIGRMIKDGVAPNGYVDLSYLSVVLGSPGAASGRRRVVTALKQWFAEFDPDARRVVFGTDWSMIVPVTNHEGYPRKVEAVLREVGLNETQLDNVFFANAVRFFGLRRGDKARSRLADYYRRNGLVQSHLNKFDGIA